MATKKASEKPSVTKKLKQSSSMEMELLGKKGEKKESTKSSSKKSATLGKNKTKEINGKKEAKPASKPKVATTSAAKKTPSLATDKAVAKKKESSAHAKKSVAKKQAATSSVSETATSPMELPVKFKKIKIEEVKLPNFKNKQAHHYNPPHIQSILEKKDEALSGEVLVKYSDADLEEFKEVILKKMEEARAELLYIQRLLAGNGSNAMGGYTHNMMEDVNVNIEQETLMQRARRQASFIDSLEKALVRIENKTYGICRVTGKLIEKGRLLAVPHATLCLEAKANAIAQKGN